MKVIIGQTAYTKLRGLSFAPEADLSGATLPICQFQADIITGATLPPGGWAELKDDLGNLWARYWIADSYRLDSQAVRLIAKSPLELLDRVELDPVLYTDAHVYDVFDDIFDAVPEADFTMDASFAEKLISGWAPRQTARQRLQWVCLVIGAYVKQFFDDRLRAVPIDDTAAPIQSSDVFWKPELSYRDPVTAVQATAFSFAQGTPTATDEYVTDGTDYYIVSRTEASLANPGVTAADPENPVTLGDVMLVSTGYISTVLSHLATYYFDRTAVEAKVVNNGAYKPGDRVQLPVDDETLVTGYISKADFSFGLQAASRLRLTAVEQVGSAILTVYRVCNGKQIGLDKYLFPVGYQYSITNRYIDAAEQGHRYIYRPTTAAVTGTMAEGSNTATVQYAVALDLYEGVLHVISVDDVTEITEGSGADQITIGVIE